MLSKTLKTAPSQGHPFGNVTIQGFSESNLANHLKRHVIIPQSGCSCAHKQINWNLTNSGW